MTACPSTFKVLHLNSLIDDVEKVWWDTPVNQLCSNGNEIPEPGKTQLVQKWSDESKISVQELNEISENLIYCLTWLAKLRRPGQIYSGVEKIYYKLKFRRMAVRMLSLMYRKNILDTLLKERENE